MSDTLGTYSFIPWLRSGVANKIETADGDPAVNLRASFPLEVVVKGSGGDAGDVSTPVTRNVALYGPGDIVGIEKSIIIRTEPHNWITNFEPNYLPYVDFYDEDFTHRYTPAAPDGNRLRPWIALVVLAEDEFTDGGNMVGRPLPFITIEATPFESVFPPADELWAWAHVQVDKGLGASEEPPVVSHMEAAEAQLRATLNSNPDLAHSRLMAPRKLAPNTAYHAFIIPAFESGRLAGLGLDPAGATHATQSAWADDRGQAPTEMPVYYRWYFRTGTRGDFEELVRLLKPKPADARVGRRDIDVQHPGSNIEGITDPALDGILKLGGALLAPLSEEAQTELEPWEQWDLSYPHPFQSSLAGFINLADDYERIEPDAANAASGAGAAIENDPDPLITPPLYGRWHALQNRLLEDTDGNPLPNVRNWIHQLNLDPRWRVAAGFGTDVVIANQEEYMDAAWDQIGDVIEASRQIRQAQLAQLASLSWYVRHLVPLSGHAETSVFSITGPIHMRAMMDDTTVHFRTATSPVTRAGTAAPLRRILRPRGPVARKVARSAGTSATSEKLAGSFVEKLNSGAITPAPPVEPGKDLPTVETVSEKMAKEVPGGGLLSGLVKAGILPLAPWAMGLLLALLFLLLMLVGLGLFGALVVTVAAGVATFFVNRLARKIAAAVAIAGNEDDVEAIDALPVAPGFTLTPSLPLHALEMVDTSAAPGTPAPASGGDSIEAERFRTALRDSTSLIAEARELGRPVALSPINLPAATKAAIQAIDPAIVLPRATFDRINIPGRIRDNLVETFVEPMAYPEIDIPMYKPLVEKSAEYFVPNLRHIPPDSVTLLQTNQPFIESYMVGLNHEFGRELLWREYLTDQRGYYFGQFWDVSAYLGRAGDDPETTRQKLKDIPPIHLWSKSSKLGDHDNRELDGAVEEEVVLVIRGELLKKYPNAVIYARPAKWQPTSTTDPSPNRNAERVLDDAADPISPLYHAKVEPDIYFFGFDLTVDEARGDPEEDDKPGWFFVFEERPGEPLFGLDVERRGALQVWNDLSWEDIMPGFSDGQLIELAAVPTPTLATEEPSGGDIEKADQWQEDHQLEWRSDIHAGELAYILFQAPMRVAIHASELLPR